MNRHRNSSAATIEKQSQTRRATGRAHHAGKYMWRVLLAEDDEQMRDLLRLALIREGHTVRTCTSGVELLNQLSSFFIEHEAVDFDLIISDIRMPGVTGLSVLEGLNARRGCYPPVVLITAFGDPETHAAARRSGAAAIIDKPFDIDHLCHVVRTILEPGVVSGGHVSPTE